METFKFPAGETHIKLDHLERNYKKVIIYLKYVASLCHDLGSWLKSYFLTARIQNLCFPFGISFLTKGVG